MLQTLVEFLKTALMFLPEFDGKIENVRSFLDRGNETVTVWLVKTTLNGAARKLVGRENSQTRIINTLQNKIKRNSVEIETAKKQDNKATQKRGRTLPRGPRESIYFRCTRKGIRKSLGLTYVDLNMFNLLVLHKFYIVHQSFPIQCEEILEINFTKNVQLSSRFSRRKR